MEQRGHIRGSREQEGCSDAFHQHDVLHPRPGQGLLALGLNWREDRNEVTQGAASMVVTDSSSRTTALAGSGTVMTFRVGAIRFQ